MINAENKKLHDNKGKELAKQMSMLQLSSQLRHTAKALPKLSIKKYNWWNESLHGVARAGVATVFPQAIAMASTFDENIIFNVASIISNEARAKFNYSQSIGDYGIYKGLTMWSPNINIYRDPRWGRGHETYGEDPYLTGILGVAFIKGLQGDNDKYLKTSACAKHFAVHSGPESKRHYFNAVISKKDLFETYLPAFKKAVIEGNVSGVMGAYNRTNDEPCCASPTLMQKLLRETWHFDGYYVSDCAALLDIVFKHHITSNPLKAAAMALNTGCDLECGVLYRLLPIAYMIGYVKKSSLQLAAARLMSIRSQLGMFDKDCPFNNISPTENATESSEQYAIEVAEKSVVLLENNGILPLKENSNKILITGYNAENELAYLGNYNGEPSSYVKILDAIKKRNVETQYSQGVHLYSESKNIDREETIQKAKNSDIIIMCTGLDSSIEGEQSGGAVSGGGGNIGIQGDRVTLELPKIQQKLLDDLLLLEKKIIILNFSGGCIDFKRYRGKVDAILQCWYPGGKGGRAISNIIFGDVSPSGKLPITFYNDIADLPDFDDYAMKNRTYRYFKGNVQYPFGYGLTYTDFLLKQLSFDEAHSTITATVKNNGYYDCDEVLQLYVT
ncbi:MAG: glycoside hydrolase family 3 C-terminal domain-containing protein, partial [Oscillospiraceae bacterium]